MGRLELMVNKFKNVHSISTGWNFVWCFDVENGFFCLRWDGLSLALGLNSVNLGLNGVDGSCVVCYYQMQMGPKSFNRMAPS